MKSRVTQILIIEDEPRAANQLEKMLNACDFNYSILDTIDSIEDAVAWFYKNHPLDLVFMDIQLADGLSFEIFQKVEVHAPIIFTTAFDQYAIQAFKVNSIDYLLKPIQLDDIQFALDKFKRSDQKDTVKPSMLKELLNSFQTQAERSGILVKEGSGFIQIRIKDLNYIYSEDGISFGVTGQKRFIIEESLDALFETLNPDQFYRINRGQIVSKRSILKINPYFNHRVKLTIDNSRDQEFVVSRQKTSDFKVWMNR